MHNFDSLIPLLIGLVVYSVIVFSLGFTTGVLVVRKERKKWIYGNMKIYIEL